MKWFKFNTIYVNGSSLSAGGGLELGDIKKRYKILHNVEYENQKLVTYGKYVADHFGCEFINEAKSGSGSPRLIRKTYEYIENVGIDKARKTLFLFEIQDPTHRVDLYLEKIQSYVTVNVSYDTQNINKITSILVQPTTAADGTHYNQEFFKGEITDEIKNHLEKYHNPIDYCEKIDGDLAGLFSYLNECGITYFFMFDQITLQNKYLFFYKKMKDKTVVIDGCRSINDFCWKNELTIKHELNDFTRDVHPGYLGNKLYGEKLINFLEQKLKPKLFVFGDSFTQSFKDHFESNNDWSVKYKNYKNYIPKNYADLISEDLEIECINRGKGGCSNYTIFDTFLENYKNISKNDIVIFNWTSESRFRIADDVNSFIDITPFTPHPAQNIYVTKKSTEEIGKNRITNSIWWKEVLNFIDIINDFLSTNYVLHWTWVDPKSVYQEDLWSDEMIRDKKLCLEISDWDQLEEELKDIISKKSDVIIDLNIKIDYQEILNAVEKNNKVTLINTIDKIKIHEEFFLKNLRLKHFNVTDYKKLCFDKFIKYKKYNTITEETNGVVEDLHYSEIGHKELYEDLIKEINFKLNENKKFIL
jgi:hypothetical protein